MDVLQYQIFDISIHALLAESDGILLSLALHKRDFYPRSPCGERRNFSQKRHPPHNFYPRSPCGERPRNTSIAGRITSFLSTLSLRRATRWPLPFRSLTWISIHALLAESDSAPRITPTASRNFYPRSPCGERPASQTNLPSEISISIHALLAESDVNEDRYGQQFWRFLSTLSLRRATMI